MAISPVLECGDFVVPLLIVLLEGTWRKACQTRFDTSIVTEGLRLSGLRRRDADHVCGAMTGKGHEDPFPRRRLKGRCRFESGQLLPIFTTETFEEALKRRTMFGVKWIDRLLRGEIGWRRSLISEAPMDRPSFQCSDPIR
jgi:hypothetical protein